MNLSAIRFKDVPTNFQRILSNIRRNNFSEFAVSYIEDIQIFSKPFGEHILHSLKLFEASLADGFRTKFSKWLCAANSVKYVGHPIENNSITSLKGYYLL